MSQNEYKLHMVKMYLELLYQENYLTLMDYISLKMNPSAHWFFPLRHVYEAKI